MHCPWWRPQYPPMTHPRGRRGVGGARGVRHPRANWPVWQTGPALGALPLKQCAQAGAAEVAAGCRVTTHAPLRPRMPPFAFTPTESDRLCVLARLIVKSLAAEYLTPPHASCLTTRCAPHRLAAPRCRPTAAPSARQRCPTGAARAALCAAAGMRTCPRASCGPGSGAGTLGPLPHRHATSPAQDLDRHRPRRSVPQGLLSQRLVSPACKRQHIRQSGRLAHIARLSVVQYSTPAPQRRRCASRSSHAQRQAGRERSARHLQQDWVHHYRGARVSRVCVRSPRHDTCTWRLTACTCPYFSHAGNPWSMVPR